MTKFIETCLLICLSSAILSDSSMGRQNPGNDEVQLKTRLVVIEAVVKEKRTGEPINDLSPTDFEVLDEGKRRAVTHFGIGEKRPPLAVVLLFDLWHNGAGRFFHQLDIPKALGAALSKLSPQDEVAITAMTGKGFNSMQRELIGFTTDRKKIMKALVKLPEVVKPDSMGVFFVADLLAEVSGEARLRRPNSQVVVVYISDSLISTSPNERRHGSEALLRQNVTFSALLTKTKKSVAARSVPFKPFLLAFGISTNGADYFAKQTGGEAIKVNKPEDYETGLERIMGDLASRYTLAFELDPSEPNDGRLHRLEVRVKARNGAGKERDLEVIARRAYYLPKPHEPAPNKSGEIATLRLLAEQSKAPAAEQAIKQAVYDFHYAVLTGDIEAIQRVTAKRTLGLCRLFFDLIFKQLASREGGQESMPLNNSEELFSFVLRLMAHQPSGENASLEHVREKARAKSEGKITLMEDKTANIRYSDGTSAKAVFEDGRWKIDDTARLKEAILKMDGLSPAEKERITNY